MSQEIPLAPTQRFSLHLLRWCCQIHQLVITIWHCIFSIMMDARQKEPYSTKFLSSTPMEHFQTYWIKGPAMQSSSHERLVRVLLRSARRTKASLVVCLFGFIWLHHVVVPWHGIWFQFLIFESQRSAHACAWVFCRRATKARTEANSQDWSLENLAFKPENGSLQIGDSDFGLARPSIFRVPSWISWVPSWTCCLIRGLFAVDPQKLLIIARSRKILKHHAVQIFCPTAMPVSLKALGRGPGSAIKDFAGRFLGGSGVDKARLGEGARTSFGQGSAFRSKFLENSNKGSAIQQEGFEGRFQGRLCCWKVLAKVAGRVVGRFRKVLRKVAQCRI